MRLGPFLFLGSKVGINGGINRVPALKIYQEAAVEAIQYRQHLVRLRKQVGALF